MAIFSALRLNVRSSSVTAMSKCLSTLRRLASRPTRRLIFSRPRSLEPLRRTISAMRRRIASVACRRSSRLRARSWARRGLKHTHQTLAGEVRAYDLRHRIGLQLFGLQRGGTPAVDRLEQLAQIRRLQRRDPVQPRRGHRFSDACGGQHAPVAHQGDALDIEAFSSAWPPAQAPCSDRRCCRRTPPRRSDNPLRYTEARWRSAACPAWRRAYSEGKLPPVLRESCHLF